MTDLIHTDDPVLYERAYKVLGALLSENCSEFVAGNYLLD